MYWCRGTELFHSIRSNHAAHVMDETCISEHCRHRFSFLCDKHAENKEGCCSQMTLLMTFVPSWCHSNMDKAVRRPWPIHYWICKITASTPSTLWQHPMWLRCFLFWSQWIFNWCFSTLRANIELPRVTQDSDSWIEEESGRQCFETKKKMQYCLTFYILCVGGQVIDHRVID